MLNVAPPSDKIVPIAVLKMKIKFRKLLVGPLEAAEDLGQYVEI